VSYLAGGAADQTDLLKKWRDFLVAAGWTLEQDVAQGTGWLVAVTKGAKHCAFRSFVNENSGYLGSSAVGAGIAMTAYSGAYVVPGTPANWWNQAGAPYLSNQNPSINVMTAIMTLPTGAIPNFWAFANPSGDNVILVAFRAAGVYTDLYIGDLVKTQAWTGGVYFGGSSSAFAPFGAGPGNTSQGPPPGGMQDSNARAFLRADVDSWVNKWLSLTTSRFPFTITATGKTVMSSTHNLGGTDINTNEQIMYGELRTRAKSSRTGGLLLLATHWLVERDFGGAISGGGWSLCGTIPDIYQTSGDGFVPGAVFNVSTDQYVVFPTFAIRKYP
jgi:hypothetical protein